MVIIKKKGGAAKAGSSKAPKLGGAGPPVYRQDRYTSGNQETKLANPRSPTAVAPTSGAYSSFDIGNLTVPTITAATVAPGFSATLQCAGDIFEITEDVTHTFTGTVTTTILFNGVLDHFTVADSTGAVVWNQSGGVMQELTNIAFLNPGAGGSLGGTSALVANTTAAQENVSQLGGFRLPASRGPWKFTPFYNSYAGSGGTQATADSPALRIGGNYSSNVGGVSSYYVESTVSLVSGYNYFNQFMAVKNVMLSGLFINGINLTQVDELYIEQNGNVIEPLITGNALAARQNSAFPNATIPANSLIFANPVLRSQFAVNDSSQSRIHCTAAQTSIKLGAYYLL
jgi:hypothetical protein